MEDFLHGLDEDLAEAQRQTNGHATTHRRATTEDEPACTNGSRPHLGPSRNAEAGALDSNRIDDIPPPTDEDAPPQLHRKGGEKPLQGTALQFDEPEPWQDEVEGAALLCELVAVIETHLRFSAEAGDAMALWTVHTHLVDAAFNTPRLVFTSPTKRCGKTTALDLLEQVVGRPVSTANIRAAALFRTIEAAHPTVLMDEADTFLNGNDDLRGILNAGHKRGGKATRCVGENHEPRIFDVFAPVAIATIGRLPETLTDRAIVLKMQRLPGTERVPRLRDSLTTLQRLRQQCIRWANDKRADLSGFVPSIPDELHSRAADNWEPLLAIAEAVGGDWPERARKAAVALTSTTAADPDAESDGVRLLRDVRELLRTELVDHERVSMTDLAARLSALEDRPWATYRRGRTLDTWALGRLLRPFGIESRSLRKADAEKDVARGYSREQFNDAFERYLEGV